MSIEAVIRARHRLDRAVICHRLEHRGFIGNYDRFADQIVVFFQCRSMPLIATDVAGAADGPQAAAPPRFLEAREVSPLHVNTPDSIITTLRLLHPPWGAACRSAAA
jgi:hypothetical protein